MISTQRDCDMWDVFCGGVFMQRLEYCEKVSYEYVCSDLVDHHSYDQYAEVDVCRVDEEIEFPFIYVISPSKYVFQLCRLKYNESYDLKVAGCKIVGGTEYANLVDQDDDLTSSPYGIDQYRNNFCDDRGVWYPRAHDESLVPFIINFKL